MLETDSKSPVNVTDERLVYPKLRVAAILGSAIVKVHKSVVMGHDIEC